ncbi:MAG: hypothetical protein NTW54_12445 [Bacteroidetes bacterium]|nr:hypothetical protein [Bacteroidota bacterium]
MMKSIAFLLFLVCTIRVEAQKDMAVYLHNGSKLIGTLGVRDSVSGVVKVKIQGGSELAVVFHDIDSIQPLYSNAAIHYGQPYLALGLATLVNSNASLFQFDILAGYQFNKKFQGGIGFCFSDLRASYLDMRYFIYHKDFYSLGVYTQPGVLLDGLFSDNYYYQGKTSGFYSNTGLSIKLHSPKTTNFSLNVGYQYIHEKEVYTDYGGNKTTNIYNLNHYIIQGIFAF